MGSFFEQNRLVEAGSLLQVQQEISAVKRISVHCCLHVLSNLLSLGPHSTNLTTASRAEEIVAFWKEDEEYLPLIMHFPTKFRKACKWQVKNNLYLLSLFSIVLILRIMANISYVPLHTMPNDPFLNGSFVPYQNGLNGRCVCSYFGLSWFYGGRSVLVSCSRTDQLAVYLFNLFTN